ncbi:MAG: hypothetical protein IJQ65_03415 [Kiritimatiellae bacterium]|nr:hypothetical protein [Kiritimatiellia bacterium]
MKYIVLGACVVLSAAAYAAESAASFVFVNPDTSSFWRTARSQSVTVPVDFPEEATTATLSVAGVGYSASYEIAAPGPYTFQLPEAATLAEENTYSLVLSFDRGESKTARLSVINGLEAGAAGSTRCVSQSNRSWGKSKSQQMTLPVPFGTTSLVVNGDSVDTGLDGAQGFFTLSGLPASMSLAVSGTTYHADVVRMPGFLLFFH